MVVRVLVLWTLIVALQAGNAFGKEKDVLKLPAQAKEDCLAGRTDSGVATLAKLHVLTGDPNFIFNQGRCYEQASRLDEAISRFREYLRVAKNASASDKKRAEEHILECQALKAEQEREKKPATTEPRPTPDRETPSVATSSPASVVPRVEPVQPAPSLPAPDKAETGPSRPEVEVADISARSQTNPGKALRIAGIAFGAVGVASIGTAIYFYARAKSLSDKVNSADTVADSDYQAGKDAQTMQWVFYSVGAGALATGLVLYLLGDSQAAPPNVGIAPVLGPGTAGLSARGTF